ncbi:MAG: replicative DNA helicase [Clostridia bacterium]|nr:replicative DNA helicase [Clostridia bacterium]
MEEQLHASVPPNSTDAERSVLGGMLTDAGALELALEQLHEEDFYPPTHKAVFAAMRDIRNRGEAVDIITLANELERHGKLDMVGGPVYLTELIDFVPTVANTQDYIDIVSEKSVRRLLIRAGNDTARDAMNDGNDIEATLNDAERRIYDISMRKSADTIRPIDQVLPNALDEINEIIERRGTITGISSGFYDLDRLTNGLQKSDLIIVAARPAMGKTAFALNIAQNAAVRDNRHVIIFSLEMSAEQLVRRLISAESAVSSQNINSGNLSPEEMSDLLRGVETLSKAKIFIDDSGGATVPDIRSKCRRLRARYGLDMIVIDYLQLMQSAKKTDSRTQEVSDITRQLKLLARELNVPIILLAQLNRGPESRTDHTPLISDLRESGSIEQDADMVMLLYRPAYYDNELDNTSNVIIAKNRHGPTDIIDLVWQGEFTRFQNLARGDF